MNSSSSNFTRSSINAIVKSVFEIKSAGTVGVDGNSKDWGMLWVDIIVDDSLSPQNKRETANEITSSAFPNVHIVATRVGEEEKGYNYRRPEGKDVVSVIFNITGHKHYDARIHKDLVRS